MAFAVNPVLEGVYHIQDVMGVCMTLLVGKKRALLVDTGYGLEDVHAYIRTLTALPLDVIVTHGHHDHCLGARWFDRTLMFPEDRQDFITYTGEETRRSILSQARAKGLAVDEEAYLSAELSMPVPLTAGDIDIGGMTARVIHCPGHTPGSAVVYVPERSLLLTADDWNPCTWVWFPMALPVQQHLANVGKLTKLPYTHVLCSHQHVLFERRIMDDFLAAATQEALVSAVPCDQGRAAGIDTHVAQLPHEQILVFDWAKAQLKG